MRFEVRDELIGLRLDQALVRHVVNMSRAKAKRFIREGLILVNGRMAKQSQILAMGDIVQLRKLPESSDFFALPNEDAALEILYEDSQCVVINKLAGLPSHPLKAEEKDTVASALVARFPEMRNIGYRAREPGIIHRLDNGTSGILIAARTPRAFRQLRELQKRDELDKRYLALCVGWVCAPMNIDDPIKHQTRARMEVVQDGATRDARAACTEVLASEPLGEFSLVRLRLHRGHRHQIRVHLASRGHPLVGDLLYGGPPRTEFTHHFLHASRVRFDAEWGRVDVYAPLPKERKDFLHQLAQANFLVP